jgi:hypothetical protein
MAGTIDMQQIAILAHTASPPDVDLGLGGKLARRELDHCREHIGFGI